MWQGHTDWVNSVAVFPDNERVASGSWDKTVRIWNMSTGEVLNILQVGHQAHRRYCVPPHTLTPSILMYGRFTHSCSGGSHTLP